jgi:hypothetical protein
MTVTLVFISPKSRLSIHKKTKIIHWISDLPTMEHNFLFESRFLLTVQNRLSSLDAMKGIFIGSLMVVIPALSLARRLSQCQWISTCVNMKFGKRPLHPADSSHM